MRLNARRACTGLALVALSLPALASGGEGAGPPVTVWVRGRADYGGGTYSLREGARSVDLLALSQSEQTLYDPQYGRRLLYKGVTLDQILKAYAPPATVDVALLHFANQMIVGLPLRSTAARRVPRVFVALGYWSERERRWSASFPPVRRDNAGYADVRPVHFSSNKVVVEGGLHPDLPEAALKTFTPWRFVDTLVSIELVRGAAYDRQFQVPGDDLVKQGFAIHKQSCGFCHAVRRVGPGHGWDFVEPVALHAYRLSGRNLFYHVRYQPFDAPAKGLLMPALSHLSRKEAEAIWHWMRAVASQKLNAYEP
ncbi:MAG: cytochrome c [Deltaproteobacteria bacterium]|nr:cytochrome c [Deltaproteobacteria bacterium]